MPNKRIPPPETVNKEIMELIEKLKEGGDNHKINRTYQAKYQEVVPKDLEAEVEEYIGKGYYERGKDREGYRNG